MGNLWKEAQTIAKKNPEIILDVTGIFDPTPISDGASGVVALFRGDFLGAGLSAVSMIPYLGDALGKTGKFAKYGAKVSGMVEALLKRGDSLANAGVDFLRKNFSLDQVARARQSAAEKVQEALLKKRVNGAAGCKDCQMLGSNRMNLPSTKGKWDAPDAAKTGTGTFTLDTPVTLPDGTKVSQISYKDGFPNFDAFAPRMPDGSPMKVQIWEVTGNATKDGKEALKMLESEGVPVPDLEDYSWHHLEDGSMMPVPTVINSSFKHTGGASIVDNALF